jgi:hypothetical protein
VSPSKGELQRKTFWNANKLIYKNVFITPTLIDFVSPCVPLQRGVAEKNILECK